MRNFVIINGCPSSIVGSTHSYHHNNHQNFLINKKPSFPFLSLHNFIFVSLSKPISPIPPPSSSSSSNFSQTKESASKLLKEERFHDLSSTFDGSLGFGFKFPIEDLIKPSDLIKTSVDKHCPRLAVSILRKEVHSGSRRLGDSVDKGVEFFDRRRALLSSVGLIAFCLLNTASFPTAALAAASRSDYADMPALRGKDYGKTKMRYPDYTETETGLQFKDLRIGTGPTTKIGDTVVVDWDGFTIGYYGRIFEARNKTKGGSFEGDDKDFFKFKVGSQEVIPAFEEAVVGMSLGGIRRIVVPPELGYPGNDYNQKGPRPTTFSGQRALDFVLRNQGLIDKTLLFDIELLKIVPN